jgi:hypothetical protein
MPTQIKIELTPEAKKIVANLQTLPPRIVKYIAAAMMQTNQLALANVKKRLVGVGPFPPEEHRLGRVSGSLYQGVRAGDAVITGDRVDTTIGTNTTNKGFSYARLHEFGGRVHVKGREHKVRLKTDARGALVRQLGHSHLAVFAKATGKRAVERTGRSADHEVDYPERAPFRTGIGEAMPDYKRNISAGIVDAWKSLN